MAPMCVARVKYIDLVSLVATQALARGRTAARRVQKHRRQVTYTLTYS